MPPNSTATAVVLRIVTRVRLVIASVVLALVAVVVAPVGAAATDDEPRVLAHHEADAIVPGGRVFLLTDSVALSAVDEIGELLGERIYTAVGFPGFHTWAAPDVLDDYPPRIKDTVIIALGNNEFDSSRPSIDRWIDEVMHVLRDTTQVIWVRPRRWSAGMWVWNEALTAADARHQNLELADWPATLQGHPEFLYGDGIHLRPAGQWAMARLLDDHIRGRALLPGRGVRSKLAAVRSGPRGIRVKGWAVDLEHRDPLDVRVRIDGVTALTATADEPRPDVEAVFGLGTDHGLELLVPRVRDGRRSVCVQAWYRTDERWVDAGCQSVDVQHSPRAHATITRTGNKVTARGWAFDPDLTNRPLRIRVVADKQKVGGPIADGMRRDVAAKFGIDPHHGFRFTTPVPADAEQVCVWAIDRPGNRNTRIACV